MFQKRVFSVLLALALSASTGLVCALDSAATTGNPLIAEVRHYNPEMTEEEILAEAEALAQEYGATVDEILLVMRDEAYLAAEEALHPIPDGIVMDGFEDDILASGGSGTRVTLVAPKYTGDIFWAPVRTAVVKHNHVGIYVDNKNIVEAPGVGKNSRNVEFGKVTVAKGAKLMYVNVKQDVRNKAATNARNMVGKPYNVNVISNKKVNDKTYNCSQLVWAAYKKEGVDLDSNGGFGVYPDDILNSNKTVTYRTL